MDSSLPSHSGTRETVWMHDLPPVVFPPLTGEISTDVIIVGGGIAGLSAAYHLTRAGKSVVVLERGELGSGETERTTAHLSCALDDRYFELERLHGLRGAQIAAASHAAAISSIESVAKLENIDCDFVRLDGYLLPAHAGDRTVLQNELAAAHRAGLTDVTLVNEVPLRGHEQGPALRFPNQGQFNPAAYLTGLARAIIRDGGRIFTGAHAAKIDGGKPARVRTDSGATVHGGAVIVATNSPVNDRVVIHTKQAPYRTYVIAATIPADAVPLALFWDTADPYHYVRRKQGHGGGEDLLIIGGEDHKSGQADDAEARYARLEEWARAFFPIGEVRYRWSGQVMEPVDGMGFIGRNPADFDNVYIATGDSGHGMTHGTIAGLLLTDLILGRKSAWEELYDPARKTAGAASEFAKENLNVAAQYTDWIAPGTAKDAREIKPGTGALVRQGLTKHAIYRDQQGRLHECSAVCPHLGGIVHWNQDEQIWECPLHGSRFDRFGKVLNGPSISDLEKASTPVEKGNIR